MNNELDDYKAPELGVGGKKLPPPSGVFLLSNRFIHTKLPVSESLQF
jgi:hypothetical protein